MNLGITVDGRDTVRDLQETSRCFVEQFSEVWDEVQRLSDGDCSVDVHSGAQVFRSRKPSLISDGTPLTDLPQPVSVEIRPWSRPAADTTT